LNNSYITNLLLILLDNFNQIRPWVTLINTVIKIKSD